MVGIGGVIIAVINSEFPPGSFQVIQSCWGRCDSFSSLCNIYSLVVAVSAKEVFGVVGLEGSVFGREVLVAHGADEAGRVEDDPQGPQDLARAERLLPALVAARVAALLLLK